MYIFLSSTPTYVSKTGSCACLRALYVPWLLCRVRDRMSCMCTAPLRMCEGSEILKCFLCGIRRNFTDKAYDFYGISKSAGLTAKSEIFFTDIRIKIRKTQISIAYFPDRSSISAKYPSFKIRMYPGESGTLRQSTPPLKFGHTSASPVPLV